MRDRPEGPRPTPQPALNEVLAALVDAVRATLDRNLVGVYLVGSFALGDHDEHSDVDFMVVTGTEIDEALVPTLNDIHARLYSMPSAWAQHLEGSYAASLLWRVPPSPGLQPTRYPFLYLDNGAVTLARSTHDNTLVARWVMRERGIALAGPPAADLIDPIEPDALRAEVRSTLLHWAADTAANPKRLAEYWYQAFFVLWFCRMLQSLETGAVHSKLAGATWARANLDGRWQGLINRAWAERADHWANVHRAADRRDIASTLAFVAHAAARVQVTRG